MADRLLTIRSRRWLGAIAVVVSAMTGCGPDKTISSGLIRAETSCDVPGLAAPLRETLVLVDGGTISPASDGAEFASKNGAFRDRVLSIADPDKAISSGTTVARERITMAVVPVDGSTAQIVFTGCVPGLSDAELAKARRDRSALANVFSSDPANALDDRKEAFRKSLIGGMTAAARLVTAQPRREDQSVELSTFLKGVRGSSGLFKSKGPVVQRVVLIGDIGGLTATAKPGATPYRSGLDAGLASGGDFGGVDLHILTATAAAGDAQEFLRGFLLAQRARLGSIGTNQIANSEPSPAWIRRYAGEVAYPSGPEPAELRVAADARGTITSSWITLLSSPDTGVPMTGNAACNGTDVCRLRSDRGGFAQSWSASPGGAPEFQAGMPFGGMRNFDVIADRKGIGGRAFDDGVYLGTSGKDFVTVTGRAISN